MMRRVARAVKRLSPNFQFFVYPGGTRVSLGFLLLHITAVSSNHPQGYGIYGPGGIFSAPLSEEMADQLPPDYLETVAYPHYRAMLSSESSGSGWSWCELVPDAIIGFTPNGSGFSLAGHWATNLSTHRLVHGEGAEILFPGVVDGYDSLFTETSASKLAKVAIFASLHPEEFKERIFNVADSAEPSSMRESWPEIARYFNLTGVAPLPTSSASGEKPSEFIKQHKNVLDAAGAIGIDIWNAAQLDSYGYWLTFDRHLSLKRLRQAGLREERRPIDGWIEAFDLFKRAGMVI